MGNAEFKRIERFETLTALLGVVAVAVLYGLAHLQLLGASP